MMLLTPNVSFSNNSLKLNIRVRWIATVQSFLAGFPHNLRLTLECCQEKGASSWLSAIPIKQHGFAPHKTNFTDALFLRYGWIPPHLPSHCVCGKAFTVSYAFSCPHGAFPIIRHA